MMACQLLTVGLAEEKRIVKARHVHAGLVAAQRRDVDRQAGRARKQPARRIHARRNAQRHAAAQARIDLGEVWHAILEHALHRDRPGRRQGAGDPHTGIGNRRVVDCDTLGDLARAHFDAPARHHAQHRAFEIAHHVAGDLGAGQVFFDDRVGHVLGKKGQLARVAHHKGVLRGAAVARLDEQRVLGLRRVELAGQPCARGGEAQAAEELRGAPLIGGNGDGRLGRHRQARAGRLEDGALPGQDGDVGVDQREDQANTLARADRGQGWHVVGRGKARHHVAAVGHLNGRRERVDIGDHDVAGQAQRIEGAAKRAQQLDAPAGAGEEDVHYYTMCIRGGSACIICGKSVIL